MKNWIVKFEIYLGDLYKKTEIQGRILDNYIVDGHMKFFILGEDNKFYEVLGISCTLISTSKGNNQNTERSERILNNHSTSQEE